MKKISKLISYIVLIIIAALVYAERVMIRDIITGLFYQEPENVLSIEEKLDLTDYAKVIFRASRPELNSKEEFATHCASSDVTVTALGCYTNSTIYIYNIESEDLDGIKESTAAHELLHAAWDRLSDGEKQAIEEDLKKIYENNSEINSELSGIYDEADHQNEIFARAGVEIKNLPEKLENLYSKYFKDQDKIVDYYNQYSKIFKDLTKEADNLKDKLDNLNSSIAADNADYKTRADNLTQEIQDFNGCASRTGCFTNNGQFTSRRNELIGKQQSLQDLYNRIVNKINEYNSLVEKLNENTLQLKYYQNMINSNADVPSL